MATLEVRSVPNLLGTPVSDAYAVKAGPWIFLTGHEAFDFERASRRRLPARRAFPCSGGSATGARAILSCNASGAP